MSARKILDDPNWEVLHFDKIGECAATISDFASEYEGDDLFSEIERIIYNHFPFPPKTHDKKSEEN